MRRLGATAVVDAVEVRLQVDAELPSGTQNSLLMVSTTGPEPVI